MNNIPQRFTDAITTGQDVRDAMNRRKGGAWRAAAWELEKSEPALGAYITTVSDTLGFHLESGGCPKEAIQEAENYILHALLVVYTVTRTAHRRLMTDFLPTEDGA